ncbi:MAG TPA: hypothetical protein DCX95_06255 [Elusimicrobia bacterium]|nr:hypothetical protein [Elusimicrobiota bacterium]
MKTFKEIKNIIQKHKDELRKKYKVQETGIFGSYVRDDQTPTSDVDILVEFSEPISLLDRASLLNYLKELLGINVDLVRKRQVRPELKESILREVVYL